MPSVLRCTGLNSTQSEVALTAVQGNAPFVLFHAKDSFPCILKGKLKTTSFYSTIHLLTHDTAVFKKRALVKLFACPFHAQICFPLLLYH